MCQWARSRAGGRGRGIQMRSSSSVTKRRGADGSEMTWVFELGVRTEGLGDDMEDAVGWRGTPTLPISLCNPGLQRRAPRCLRVGCRGNGDLKEEPVLVRARTWKDIERIPLKRVPSTKGSRVTFCSLWTMKSHKHSGERICRGNAGEYEGEAGARGLLAEVRMHTGKTPVPWFPVGSRSGVLGDRADAGFSPTFLVWLSHFALFTL